MLKPIRYWLLFLVALCCFRLEANAQDRTITGTVTDAEDNINLPGVNVLVKGTTTGTVTDVEGNYQLQVADDAATLVLSSVGYETQEVTIGNQTQIDVSMAPDVQSLSEVVVIGLRYPGETGGDRRDQLHF